MSTRLLEAIVDIQHWLKHDIDEPCGSCIRFDELQLAAMELIKTSEARIAELEAVAEEAESLFRMYGHQDWCLEFTDLEQFLLAAGYLK